MYLNYNSHGPRGSQFSTALFPQANCTPFPTNKTSTNVQNMREIGMNFNTPVMFLAVFQRLSKQTQIRDTLHVLSKSFVIPQFQRFLRDLRFTRPLRAYQEMISRTTFAELPLDRRRDRPQNARRNVRNDGLQQHQERNLLVHVSSGPVFEQRLNNLRRNVALHRIAPSPLAKSLSSQTR